MTARTLLIENLTATAVIDGRTRTLVDDLTLTVRSGRSLALVVA